MVAVMQVFNFRLVVAVVVLVTVFSASSCSGDSTSTVDSAAENPPAVDSFSAVVLRGESSATTHNWFEEQVYLCMKQDGFEYKRRPFSAVAPAEVNDTLEYRQEFGFGFAEGSGGVFSTDGGTIVEEVDAVSQAEFVERAETEGRCIEQANQQQSELVDQYMASLSPEQSELITQVASFDSPGFNAAYDLWSQCMAKDGFKYAHPFEMYAELSSTAGQADKLDEEIAIAVADWHCFNNEEVKSLIDNEMAELDKAHSDQFFAKFESN